MGGRSKRRARATAGNRRSTTSGRARSGSARSTPSVSRLTAPSRSVRKIRRAGRVQPGQHVRRGLAEDVAAPDADQRDLRPHRLARAGRSSTSGCRDARPSECESATPTDRRAAGGRTPRRRRRSAAYRRGRSESARPANRRCATRCRSHSGSGGCTVSITTTSPMVEPRARDERSARRCCEFAAPKSQTAPVRIGAARERPPRSRGAPDPRHADGSRRCDRDRRASARATSAVARQAPKPRASRRGCRCRTVPGCRRRRRAARRRSAIARGAIALSDVDHRHAQPAGDGPRAFDRRRPNDDDQADRGGDPARRNASGVCRPASTTTRPRSRPRSTRATVGGTRHDNHGHASIRLLDARRSSPRRSQQRRRRHRVASRARRHIRPPGRRSEPRPSPGSRPDSAEGPRAHAPEHGRGDGQQQHFSRDGCDNKNPGHRAAAAGRPGCGGPSTSVHTAP